MSGSIRQSDRNKTVFEAGVHHYSNGLCESVVIVPSDIKAGSLDLLFAMAAEAKIKREENVNAA